MNSLLVGGIRDGEMHDIPADRPFWTVCDRSKDVRANFDPNVPVEPSVIRQENYQRMLFRGIKETYTIFGGEGMTPDSVLAALIQNYVPLPTREQKAERLSQVSRATIDAKLLGCGFLMIWPDNSFQHIPAEAVSIDHSKLKRSAQSEDCKP